MRIEYVFNTAGEYAAFVADGYLFTPSCGWLGSVGERRVYNTDGELVGELFTDGRIVRDRSVELVVRRLPPSRPMRPVRPMPPQRRLFMERLAAPLQDVFLGLRRPLTGLAPVAQIVRVNALAGARIVADDGTFLGRVSRSPDEPESLVEADAPWASPTAQDSLFNPSGPYGSRESPLSPFHPTATAPPRLEHDGETIAHLSTNPELPERVDPNALVSWLASG